jgi:cathepsin L
MRKEIFEANKRMIVQHNNANLGWKLGANKLMDFTETEHKALRGFNHAMALQSKAPRTSLTSNGVLPDAVDWREKGVTTPVKDQGQCGSCWAFAVAETVEAHLAIATGKLLVLSPQNVVSCTKNPNHCGGSGGCDGATAELGFNYINQSGIALEQDWKYRAVTGTCLDPKINKVATVSGFVKLEENSYEALVTALATVGPVAVSVDASTWSFYSSGIYDGCGKHTLDIDHAVQAVGYGSENGKDYWIVRNSWGPTWGERGHIRLLRHSDGDRTKWCYKDNTPGDGSGCRDGPPSVVVCGTCGIWYDNSYPTGAALLNKTIA